MNFIKVTIVLGIAFLMNLMIPRGFDLWKSNSTHNVSRSSELKSNLPNAYMVNIIFNEDNYEHTHTINGGTYQINIEVIGSPIFLSSGKLSQITCDLNCYTYTDDSNLTGNINIQLTITFFGDREESEIKEEWRGKIINIILQEIQKI